MDGPRDDLDLEVPEAVLSAAEAEELTAAILARTSRRDRVASAAAALSRELPALASIEPDPGFAAEVLARTVRQPSPLWRRFIERPRLTLEAAYVAATVALLLIGLPASPLASVPRAAIDGVPAAQEVVRRVGTSAERIGELGPQGWAETLRDRVLTPMLEAVRSIGAEPAPERPTTEHDQEERDGSHIA